MYQCLRLSVFERSFCSAIVGICLFPTASFSCQQLVQRHTMINITNLESRTITAGRKAKQQPTDLASWQGKYDFIETRLNQPQLTQRKYRIRISLARCGWRAFLTIKGPQQRFDIQAQVIEIDADTIGIYYEQDQVPRIGQPQPFRSGALLLRLQRTASSSSPTQPNAQSQQTTYRAYFEELKPLISANQITGIELTTLE